MNEIEQIKQKLREFTNERDWDKYHHPKDLAISMSLEVAEVLEHFQWKTNEEISAFSVEQKQAIGEEIADVFCYLIRLSDKLDIDLIAVTEEKMKKKCTEISR